ncbi:YdcF family protein [Enterococcus sp. BWB1-3]|uniref:YdcF family protein n=1 Tax=unclassified Enterococcus TaxID=2608891 RepID=UPI0019222858|nr:MULTISPECIES: YdcF family protein [unclassified Enterococcus]MBL1230668.1 YdcF family protein [Enterococcus sp. BWB1-3]MCB5956029.1 YdcF family protein [Enterococcus sp. CWB-B31]
MKKLKKVLAVIVILCSIYIGSIFFLILKGTKEIPAAEPDTILILGAQVRGQSKETAYPSTVLKERLNTAISYIDENPQAVIIVCGGQGSDEPDSEANVMAGYLIANGVSSSRIIREDQSTRTKENITNALEKRDLGKTVIVTSDFHIYRSKLLANRLGIEELSGLPAKSESSVTARMYAREIIALSYAVLFDW